MWLCTMAAPACRQASAAAAISSGWRGPSGLAPLIAASMMTGSTATSRRLDVAARRRVGIRWQLLPGCVAGLLRRAGDLDDGERQRAVERGVERDVQRVAAERRQRHRPQVE